MFKHVLIPTDGSPLSQRAALGAIGLAKALSARVTAISVSAPFHVFSANPKVKDTAEGYKEDCEKRAAAYLDGVGKAAATAGVAFDGMHVFAERAYAAIDRGRRRQGLRRDLHGVARTHRIGGGVPRQRDGRSVDALAHPGRRVAVSVAGAHAGRVAALEHRV